MCSCSSCHARAHPAAVRVHVCKRARNAGAGPLTLLAKRQEAHDDEEARAHGAACALRESSLRTWQMRRMRLTSQDTQQAELSLATEGEGARARVLPHTHVRQRLRGGVFVAAGGVSGAHGRLLRPLIRARAG